MLMRGLLLSFAFNISTLCNAQTVQKIVLNFNFNESTLSQRAQQQLDAVGAAVKLRSATLEKIEILGHCDSIGNNDYNDKLSKQRAETVNQYLLAKGVRAKIITQDVGYGKRLPLNSNSTEEERHANRRVEVLIYWKSTTPTASLPKQAQQKGVDSTATIDLSNVQVNQNLVLENINFYPDTHVILPKSIPSLKMLLNTMQQNPDLTIEIQGHICCNGGNAHDAYDELTHKNNLSTARAEAIRDYLTTHGVRDIRIQTRGFGGAHPLVKETTEADKEKNRRVEIKILSK
jgi:outer membrane protein OmpA-like peptidoglycan-associated protein